LTPPPIFPGAAFADLSPILDGRRLKPAQSLFDEGDILSWRDNCHCSIRTPILERSVLDIQNPAASGIARWGDRSVSNRNYTLPSSKLAGCPESDVAARCEPLKNDNRFEFAIFGVAAIDLEYVRLNGDLILTRWSYLTGLDKLDVGIRVIDPDRSRASDRTFLYDTQGWLVIFRVCGSHLQHSGCRLKGAFV